MHPVRRIACIVLGLALAYAGALLLEPMMEAGRFIVKWAVASFFLLSVGGLLAVMGAFPKLTRNW